MSSVCSREHGFEMVAAVDGLFTSQFVSPFASWTL